MASGGEEITTSVSQNSDVQDYKVPDEANMLRVDSQQTEAVRTPNPEEIEAANSQDHDER